MVTAAFGTATSKVGRGGGGNGEPVVDTGADRLAEKTLERRRDRGRDCGPAWRDVTLRGARKVYRLRLDAAGSPAAAAPKTAGTREGNPSLARRRQGGKRKLAPQVPPAAGRRGKTLLELTNATCRWPHGRPGAKNFFFCGAAGADLERGIPYCARHMQRAYPAIESVARNDKRPVSGGARLLLPSIRYVRPQRPSVRTG
jgi:GcrA cell cycle regulator